MYLNKLKFLGLMVIFLLYPTAFASPLIEKRDRLEINWSRMRVVFYGIANKSAGSQEDYRTLEKKAFKEGLNWVQRQARGMYFETFESMGIPAKNLSEGAQITAHEVTQSLSSIHTVYYADGGVRVILENTLPRFLDPKGVTFGQKEHSSQGVTQYSGIIFKLDRAIRPRAFYRVVDPSGEVLFDYRSMAEDAFKRNLMGRWFQGISESEAQEAVGLDPLTIECQILANESLQVDRLQWEAGVRGHKGLLVAGAIALSMP